MSSIQFLRRRWFKPDEHLFSVTATVPSVGDLVTFYHVDGEPYETVVTRRKLKIEEASVEPGYRPYTESWCVWVRKL